MVVGLQRELQVRPFAALGAAAETQAAQPVGRQHCGRAAQPGRVELQPYGRRPVEDRVGLGVALAVVDVHGQADLELMSGGIPGTVVGAGVHPDVVWEIPRPGGERGRRDAVRGLDGGLAVRVDRAGGLGCGVVDGDLVNVGNLDGHHGESGAAAAVGDSHDEGVGGLDLEVQLLADGQLPGSVVDGEKCRVDAAAGVCKRIAVGVGGCDRRADMGALGGLFGHRPLRQVAFGEHRGLVGLTGGTGAVVHHAVVDFLFDRGCFLRGFLIVGGDRRTGLGLNAGVAAVVAGAAAGIGTAGIAATAGIATAVVAAAAGSGFVIVDGHRRRLRAARRDSRRRRAESQDQRLVPPVPVLLCYYGESLRSIVLIEGEVSVGQARQIVIPVLGSSSRLNDNRYI